MSKFRDWLLSGVSLDVKPNVFGIEVLSYLAYETVAQVQQTLCQFLTYLMLLVGGTSQGRDENGKMDVWCEVTRYSSK